MTLTPLERANQVRDHVLRGPDPTYTNLLPPGCIILTAEEAEQVRVSLDLAGAVFTSDEAPTLTPALALLQEAR